MSRIALARHSELEHLYIRAYSGLCASLGMLRKSARNLRARGFDFEFATQVFDQRTVERVDTRRDLASAV